jgi:hypothetical protein
MVRELVAEEEITFLYISGCITRRRSKYSAVMAHRVRDVTSYCPDGFEGLKTDSLETTVRLWKDSN